MEEEVDYSRHYQQLIAKHGYATKPDDDNYYERHHIVPKSLGGSNDSDNLVYLTGKAHYVAHYLLFKIYGGGPMASAFWNMSVADPTGERRIPNGRSFETARKAHADRMLGEGNPMYGTERPQEVRARISAKLTGRKVTFSKEHSANLSKAQTGHKHPRARPVNIYCYNTNELIAGDVILRTWCLENGNHQSNLGRTTRADLKKPSSATNVHQAKGLYARYIDEARQHG